MYQKSQKQRSAPSAESIPLLMDTYCYAVFATLVIGVCHGLEASQAAKAAPVATALNACTRPHSNHYIWQD